MLKTRAAGQSLERFGLQRSEDFIVQWKFWPSDFRNVLRERAAARDAVTQVDYSGRLLEPRLSSRIRWCDVRLLIEQNLTYLRNVSEFSR